MEERIARLEETVFFQERLLQDLNAALTGQQRQLDAMEREGQRDFPGLFLGREGQTVLV